VCETTFSPGSRATEAECVADEIGAQRAARGWRARRIGVTTDQSSRVVRGENKRVPSASFPESSCTRSHLAMSVALALMPPRD